jgi:pectate lyase
LALPAVCPAAEEPASAFPGARGFGIRTPAGRGGRVLKVTNLHSQGPGSLRDALVAKGPRVVVFEVGGVIDLQTKELSIAEPFLTVAGQTAPSPGITLIRGSVVVRTHDVVLRHLRIRPGDAGRANRSGWEPEVTTFGPDAHDIVVDHCSLSWAVDENLSASGPRYDGPRATSRNITFSNCIVAEGLYDSSHSKGPHSMGSLIHDNCTNVAIIGNLYAHNNQRNPFFKANTTGVVVNNVIYNPGRYAIQLDWPASEWKGRPSPQNPRVSIVGNVLLHGADTAEGLALVSRKGDAYLADNLAFDRAGNPAAITAGLIDILPERPVWPRGLHPLPASRVVDSVLRRAGARPKDRDDADKRVVQDVRDRKGRFINSQDDVGGYPKSPMTRRRLTVPEDVEGWLAKLAAEVE